MKKTLLLIIFITIISLLLLSLAIALNKAGKPAISQPPVTPGIHLPAESETLKVVGTRPPDKATGVALNQAIVITFNRSFLSGEVQVTSLPEMNFTLSLRDKSVILTPAGPYAPGTRYKYAIHYLLSGELPSLYSFTTTGPAQTQLPDTQPAGGLEAENADLRKKHPDIFLRNLLPYSGSSFSINFTYQDEPSGHYAFSVTHKGDQNLARSESTSWLKSLGLTDEQISKLDIAYQSL